MKFFAIAYKYQEDVFYDFEKEEDNLGLESTCLLPTKKIAEQIIEDELSVDYVAVEIDIETLSRNGVWSHTRGIVENWDE